jgi:Cof subfamily protein (haloacid dehalogenase superfamily)
MSIRLIAVDVDGTLLNTKKQLTRAVADAIGEVKRCGFLFTIATGRDILGLRDFGDLLSPEVPVITYNGAEIRRAGSGELISSVCLSRESAKEIIGQGLNKGFSVIVWCRGVLYIGQPGVFSRGYSEMYGIREKELTDVSELCAKGVTKVIWAGETTRIGTLEKERKLAPIPGSECCTSDPSYLEFMAEGVNKGAGLQAAADSLGLSRQEVMAVGDGHNDLPMLQWAGVSVAMGNASWEVKQAARFLTDDCDRDGLAVALKRLILTADPLMQPDSEGSN